MKVLRSVTYVAECELKTFLGWHSWVSENWERLNMGGKHLFYFDCAVTVQNLFTTSITLFLRSVSEITVGPNWIHFLFCALEHITIQR
jgi:hypothetical protein